MATLDDVAQAAMVAHDALTAYDHAQRDAQAGQTGPGDATEKHALWLAARKAEAVIINEYRVRAAVTPAPKTRTKTPTRKGRS